MPISRRHRGAVRVLASEYRFAAIRTAQTNGTQPWQTPVFE